MDKIVRTLLIAVAMGLSGCDLALTGTSLATDPDGGRTVLISDSPGGNIDAFERAFSRWSRLPGVSVEIRHWCASACTQVLGHFGPQQICLWPGARMGFHAAVHAAGAARWPGREAGTDAVGTLMMFAGYPDWLQARLAAAGVMGLGGSNPSATVGADEFWQHGYRACAGDQTAGQAPPAGPRLARSQ